MGKFFYEDTPSFSNNSETETTHGLGDNKFEVETKKFCIKMLLCSEKLSTLHRIRNVKDGREACASWPSLCRRGQTFS